MAIDVAVKHQISEEEYLQGELISEIKRELIDGEVHAMSRASKNHDHIAGNVYTNLLPLLENSLCEPFSSDVKVKVGGNFFCPDVMVACDDRADNPCYNEIPTILVEVLSKTTRRNDETIKRLAYQSIPSLQEYLLIEQDFVDVEVCCRKNGWLSQHYFLGDEFTLYSISIVLSVEDIYRRVQNEDVVTYLQEKVDVDAS
jgi:Uma2 family endonuclease